MYSHTSAWAHTLMNTPTHCAHVYPAWTHTWTNILIYFTSLNFSPDYCCDFLKFLWKFTADLYAWKVALMILCFDNFWLNLSTGTFWPREGETDFCKLDPKELVSNLEFYSYPERQWQGRELSTVRKETQVLAFKSLPDVSVRRLEDWLGLLSTSLFSPLYQSLLIPCPYPTQCHTHT